MIRKLSSLPLLFALAGCATSGPLDFVCPGFTTNIGLGTPYAVTPRPSLLERQIHSGEIVKSDIDPLSKAFERYYSRPIGTQALGKPEGMLLLSGGGQWGAFGAGYLSELRDQKQLPHFIFISGISTGALQALAIAAGQAGDTREAGGGQAAFDAMLAAYSPQSEDEIVNRRPFLLATITGSVAGLKPLRARMNDIVCATAESDPSVPCLVDDLKTLDIPVLLGFVAAASGDFQYVDAVEIAKHARSRKEARDCLVGAALASSAMPVFLQQVRINKKAYYDGGVRESVFAARTVASAESARKAASGTPPSVPVYVVRNGPTRAAALAKDDPSPDAHADALTAAMRAEPIIVNQIEVGSIAALRLEDPQGPVNLITADGWQNAKPACVKKPKVMFQPDFMQCLRSFGRARAMGAKGGWISLDPVSVAGPQK